MKNKMKKILNYISIAIVTFAMFSCNKNEWTPEKESDFKDGMKKELRVSGKGIFSDDQINYISDCVLEKIKSKNLKPNDSDKPGTSVMVMQMGKECAQESFAKSKPLAKSELNNSWNADNEKIYKNLIIEMLVKNKIESEAASSIADCALSKLKKENIGPVDLQNPKNQNLVQQIAKDCRTEFLKKK